eukprot:6185425-Pleurochrysis_carterae.AAC.1
MPLRCTAHSLRCVQAEAEAAFLSGDSKVQICAHLREHQSSALAMQSIVSYERSLQFEHPRLAALQSKLSLARGALSAADAFAPLASSERAVHVRTNATR